MSFMAEGISLGRWKKKPVWAEQVCEGKIDSFMASYSLPLTLWIPILPMGPKYWHLQSTYQVQKLKKKLK